MGCPCKKINAILICNVCGSAQNLRYRADEDALTVAKRQGKRCKNKECLSKDISVKE